jgi:hypothetical protein
LRLAATPCERLDRVDDFHQADFGRWPSKAHAAADAASRMD